MNSYSRILVAIDGSPAQTQVIEKALALAEAHHAEVLLAHVVDSAPFESTGCDFRALAEERQAELEKQLAPTIEAVAANPLIKGIRLDVQAGRINSVLEDVFIKDYNPDLVVCGERGLSNLQYAFIGSVSTFLVHHVRCDVLVVKDL